MKMQKINCWRTESGNKLCFMFNFMIALVVKFAWKSLKFADLRPECSKYFA